jgi:acetate kinase
MFSTLPDPDAVGHRIVHGGTIVTSPVVIDQVVRGQLGELTDLAPLHQPKSLAALDAISGLLPSVAAVGVSTPRSTRPCRPPRRPMRFP